MDVPQINIDELHTKRLDREEKKKKCYEEVLRRCHHRIKLTSNNESYCFCFYAVPNIIFGIPLYDTTSCIIYVVNKLIENGFDVKYTHPNLIFISWLNKFNKKVKSIESSPTQDKKKKYKNINDYKPSGNFIYNQESIDLLSNKTYKLLED